MFIFIFSQSGGGFFSEVDVVIGSYLISITHVIMALDMNTAPNMPHTWRKHILIPGDKLPGRQKSDGQNQRQKHSRRRIM